jgi:hypothetical protein
MSSRNKTFFNALTLLVFIGVLAVVTVGVALLLAPPPVPALTPLPTFIGELPSLTPSNTPTATATGTATLPPTFTPRPSETATPTATASRTALPSATPLRPSETPSHTPTPSITPTPTETPIPFPYIAQGEPVLSANTVNSLACAWQGVGGEVVGLTAAQAATLRVRVVSDAAEATAALGSNSLYGRETGWEVVLGTRPAVLLAYVRLESLDGLPQSPEVLVRFGGECTSNLARVTFTLNPRYTP